MASVTKYTLDRVKRTLFFRTNARGIPVQLPFDMITIDEDFQGYQPISYRGGTEKGDPLKGSADAAVFVDRNMALPKPPNTENPDKYGVWLYFGI